MNVQLIALCIALNSIAFTINAFEIKFIIDRQYDEAMIYNMFKLDDPAGLVGRAYSMGIDIQFAYKIQKAESYNAIKSELDQLVNERYRRSKEVLENSQKDYAVSWKPIIKEFSDVIQEITENNWFYKSYLCVLSPFHPGISNWYGNKIVRIIGEDPIEQRRITAHEVVLSHVFHIFRKYYYKSQVDDWKIWSLSEISTVFILDDNRLLKYWKNYLPRENYFSGSNYPQLGELERKLKPLYTNRESFRKYIDNAIDVVLQTNIDNKASPKLIYLIKYDNVNIDLRASPSGRSARSLVN